MNESPAERKGEIRRRMRVERAALDPQRRRLLEARVEARVLALREVQEAGTVLLFYAFGDEVGTRVLARRLHERGKRLLLPFLRDRRMAVAEVRRGDALTETAYGPREPAREVAVDPAEVEVTIVPGLAFDRSGGRIGYGGGHYDRFLAGLAPGSVGIGVGFAFQLVDPLPLEPHDVRLDLIVTDEAVIDARARPL